LYETKDERSGVCPWQHSLDRLCDFTSIPTQHVHEDEMELTAPQRANLWPLHFKDFSTVFTKHRHWIYPDP